MKKRFAKTFNHIYYSLMLVASVLLIALGTASGLMITGTLRTSYETLAMQKLDRGVSACKNYVQSVLLSVGNISRLEEVIAFADGTTDEITADLTLISAKQTSAIVVYASDGRTYTPSDVDTVPSLEQLSQDSDLNDFFTMELDEFVSLRKERIALSYDGMLYDSFNGIVSCCRKIYGADGKTIGYVIADVFPYYLYRYFDFSEDDAFGGSLPIIQLEGKGYFPYESNGDYLSDFASARHSQGMPIVSEDGKYMMITSSRNFFDGTITVGFALQRRNGNESIVIIIIVSVAIVAIVCVHFAAYSFAGSTDKRLGKLLDKMKQRN